MKFMFAKFKVEIIDILNITSNILKLAQFNRLDILEIIYSNTDALNGIYAVVDHASLYGNFEIVKYLTAMVHLVL